nr:hypothetical protein [Angustibacter aerolatus]
MTSVEHEEQVELDGGERFLDRETSLAAVQPAGAAAWPRTTRCRCSSARASWPSSPATSTSSSWSASPG